MALLQIDIDLLCFQAVDELDERKWNHVAALRPGIYQKDENGYYSSLQPSLFEKHDQNTDENVKANTLTMPQTTYTRVLKGSDR